MNKKIFSFVNTLNRLYIFSFFEFYIFYKDKSMLIELSKQEPLFSKIEEKIVDNQKVVHRISYSKANLYICKIKG